MSWFVGCVAVVTVGVSGCGPDASPEDRAIGSRIAIAAIGDTSTVGGACDLIKTYEADLATTTADIEASLISDPDSALASYKTMSGLYGAAAAGVKNQELKASLERSGTSFSVYAAYQAAVINGTADDFDSAEVLAAASDIAVSSSEINTSCGTSIGVEVAAPSAPAASAAASPSASVAASSAPQAAGTTEDDCAVIYSYDPQLIAISDKTQAALEKDPAGAAAGYKQTADLYTEMAGKVGNPELKAALQAEQAAMIVYFKYQRSTAAGNLGANSYDKVTAAAKEIQKADKVIIGICGPHS